MELKRQMNFPALAAKLRSNRTFMELKQQQYQGARLALWF